MFGHEQSHVTFVCLLFSAVDASGRTMDKFLLGGYAFFLLCVLEGVKKRKRGSSFLCSVYKYKHSKQNKVFRDIKLHIIHY